MAWEPVEVPILRTLAPEEPQARFCLRVGDPESDCPKEHVDAVEVVVDGVALARLCAGHFPGRPIVPGSHLVALMVEAARLLPGAADVDLSVHRAVFRAPVGPERGLWISARRGRVAGRVDVEVRVGGEGAASEGGAGRSVVASARIEAVS